MTAMNRIAATVAIAVVALVASAGPASAHSVSGVGATNYKTTLLSVKPSVPGVTMRVIETGSRFELTNSTGTDIVVLGYQDEPYLRIGPHGVFENRRSPAAYLNGNRRGTSAVPGSADPKAAPEWHKVSSGHTARWHDHRIHWMGNQDPPQVRRQPGQRHVVIPSWAVKMTMDGSPLTATGNLVWIPGPSPLPWVALALVALGVAVAAGFQRRWNAPLGALLAVLLVVDVAHAVGIAWSAAGGPERKLAVLAGGSFLSFFAWVIAAVGLWMLARRSTHGLFAAAMASSFIALAGGLADVTDLSRSAIPFAWAPVLARAFVALSLGLGVGITAGAIIALQRTPLTRRRPTETVPVPTA